MIVLISLILITSLSHADVVRFEVDEPISLRMHRTQYDSTLSVIVHLAPGSIIRLDPSQYTGPRNYENAEGQVVTSRSGWFENVELEYYEGDLPDRDIRWLQRQKLYLSVTFRSDLVAIDPKYPWDIGESDEQSRWRGQIGTLQRRVLTGLVTLRELTGRKVLKKVIDVPRGSILDVKMGNTKGPMKFQSSSGKVKKSSRGWIQGIVIVQYNGKLSQKRMNAINRKKLFVSEEIQELSRPQSSSDKSPPDERKNRGNAKNPYPRWIKIRTNDKTSCLPKKLWNILRKAAQKFGKPVHILSAYRSRAENKARDGASNSQHIYCRAADVSIPGVAGKKLARFLTTVPGRGGVGFYCGDRIHIDVAKRRQWGGCQ